MANVVTNPQKPVECQNFVRGMWKTPHGTTHEILSPYYGKVVGHVAESTPQDVNEAVEAAHQAQIEWAKVPIKERCKVMFQFRELILRDIEKLSQTVSLESGKTLAEAKAGVMKGVEVLEFAISLQNMDFGGKLEVSRGVYCEYRREPLGVVTGITPFNFPIMVPMWMIPIAITLGNAFVWKPSDKTPLASLLLAEISKEAGIPAGILTVVQGGKTCVEALLDHPLISAAGFVGSSSVAKAVYQRGAANGKRVLALGGAKNHIILMPDAEVQMTARGVTDSFTGCAGQRCMAASVLLAVGEVQHFISEIVKKSSEIKVGEDMGAIISKESYDKICRGIDRAEKEGAKILLDGRKLKPPVNYQGGYWLGPTILDQVDPKSEIAQVELFGPVLTIIRLKTLSEALAVENANPYGNAASVFTSNGAVAERVAAEAKAGMVGVNIGVPVPREPFSFGGMFESKFGQGDITGESSLEFWTNLKKVTSKWSLQKDNNWMS